MMDDVLKYADELVQSNPRKEVFPFEVRGKKYWLKISRPTGSNLLHRSVWKLTHFPLLLPVTPQTPDQTLAHETHKILRLRQLKIAVPTLVGKRSRWFVMTDTGINLRSLLKKQYEPKMIQKVFTALGTLHRLGEYHGGAQLRNLTWSDGKVHFIDFEERFGEENSLKTIQLRDLFLLLFSFEKDSIPLDYSQCVSSYCEVSKNSDFGLRLKSMAEQISWLERTITFPPLWKILDRDTRSTYRLIQELKKLA